ncbi:MAG: hypothetical protein AAF826_03820 [Pseudomonadota bacterium]
MTVHHEHKLGFAVTFAEPEIDLVRQEYSKAKVILEYGSGGSTFLALESGVDTVISVESDARWAERIDEKLSEHFESYRFRIFHIGISPTKAWGRPKTNEKFLSNPGYSASLFDQNWFRQPDPVLINGRFRAACFLACVLRIKKLCGFCSTITQIAV